MEDYTIKKQDKNNFILYIKENGKYFDVYLASGEKLKFSNKDILIKENILKKMEEQVINSEDNIILFKEKKSETNSFVLACSITTLFSFIGTINSNLELYMSLIFLISLIILLKSIYNSNYYDMLIKDYKKNKFYIDNKIYFEKGIDDLKIDISQIDNFSIKELSDLRNKIAQQYCKRLEKRK